MQLTYRKMLIGLTSWQVKLLTVISLLIFNASSIHAEYSPQEEYETKAQFLYNVARMAHWPETESQQPLVFCFLGKDVFGNTLNAIKNKQIAQ